MISVKHWQWQWFSLSAGWGACDPTDCRAPGSSVREISEARTLEWVALSSSRASSQPRNQTCDSCIAGGFFNHCRTREAPQYSIGSCQRLFPNFKPLIKPGCGRFYSGPKCLLLHHERQLNLPAMLVADLTMELTSPFKVGKSPISMTPSERWPVDSLWLMNGAETMCVSPEHKLKPLSFLPQDQLAPRHEMFLQLGCQLA